MRLILCYILLTRQQFAAILGELMKKFSSFIGSQTYAASKNKLRVYDTPFRLEDLLLTTDIGDDDKKRSFFADSIIYGIRATKEGPSTKLYISTPNNPYDMLLPHQTYNTFWKEAWEQSANIVEFTILMTGSGSAFEYVRFDNPAISGFVRYNIQNIRARRYDVTTLVQMYEIWENNQFNRARLTAIHLNKSNQMSKEWVKNIQNTSTILTTPKYKSPMGLTSLKLGNLIRSLFEQDIPGASNVPAFLREVSEVTTEKSPLQIIEIAVNEGTVKPFIEATMTELVQNSIDVIREFNPADKTIDITLNKVAGSSPVELELSIIDRVGMSSDAFIYVGIPFLSTKTPSELVTGEMGSGFFNSYRESSSVRVRSVRDGYSRLSYDTPIRDERNRVIDINKKIEVKRDKTSANGTTISVVFPTDSLLDEVTKIARVDYTARNILGLALIQGIKYNGADITIPKVLGAKIGYFELYFTDPDTTLKHESYLLTKGVPFAPLSPYFKTILTQRVLDVIDRNFIVNIIHGGYTPVQTRTRINIPLEVQADFRKVAIYAVFITMVRDVFKGHRTYALDHLESTADANQLKFTTYNVENFIETAGEDSFLKYTSFFDQPTIARMINNCIDVMGSELYKNRINDVDAILTIYNSPYPEVNSMVRAIIIRWLSNKNQDHKPPSTEEGKVPQKVKGGIIWVDPDTVPDRPDLVIERIVNAWVQTYWKLAIEIGVVGYKRVNAIGPTVVAINSLKNQSKNGWYSPLTNTITINTYNWDDKDREHIIKVLKENSVDSIETKLKGNKTWDTFFGYRFPAAVLPHEAEHLRRRQSHDQGGHDSIHIALFPGDQDQTRTFDQGANIIFQQILGRGFYEAFFKLPLFAGKK